MRKIGDINSIQARIIGSLLEKEQATPDYYPPTSKALLAACNQKSNRDPVMDLELATLMDELETLRTEVLVWRNDSGRAPKWSQSISRRLDLTPPEKAVLTVLLLRGPQTVGELRSRTERLHPFPNLEGVESTLESLAIEDRELVTELPRRPGQKENRWAHLLSGDVPASSGTTSPSDHGTTPAPSESSQRTTGAGSLTLRVEKLESEVAELRELLQLLLDDADS